MSTRSYPRLSVEEFGLQLLTSGDLDPVYVALRRVPWPAAQLKRFLVAYWCCYHCGVASWMSEREGEAFWDALYQAARNETASPVGGRWPRAPERRHWRAKNAVTCVDDLKLKYARPEQMVDYVSSPLTQGLTVPVSYKFVKQKVTEHVAFGPWIAFKVADMLERVLDVPVDFGYEDIMYEEPRKAALMVFRDKGGFTPDAKVKDEPRAVQDVVEYLADRFKHNEAPPRKKDCSGRSVGLQEVETILCKWKSHMNGHYPLNNDLVEIEAGLEPWERVSEAAINFLDALPRVDQPAAVA